MTRLRLNVVNVIAELERYGVEYDSAGNDEVRCKCPVHSDNSPSVNINTEKGLWQCHASNCGAKGDIVAFLCHVMEQPREVIIAELSKRYDLEDIRSINPENVEKFRADLDKAGALLEKLEDRGITREIADHARLGFFKGRITIPVFNQGRVVNIRRYLPGAPGAEKMKNTRGYGQAAIYQRDQLEKYDKIIICGGELKALVAGWYLNELGIGAIAVSAGEGTWKPEWNKLLEGKSVYLCMDIDAAGIKATRMIGTMLIQAVDDLRVCRIPLSITDYPKGDLNDWVGQEKAGTKELHEMILAAEVFEPPTVEMVTVDEKDVKEVKVKSVPRPENIGRLVKFTCVVAAMHDQPYLVPQTVKVNCTRDQKHCATCPVFGAKQDENGESSITMPRTSAGVLDFLDQVKSKMDLAMRSALGIPPCRVAALRPERYYSVFDSRLTEPVAVTSHSGTNMALNGFLVDIEDIDANTSYEMTGVVYPHPKNQQAVVLITGAERVEDSLESYAPTEDALAELEVFRPRDWTEEGISKKLDEYYRDIEVNVTRIFGRREMHQLVDLTYLSVMGFKLEGREVPGWINSLIIGDSSQGKSEVTSRMIDHYKCGERVECKNSTTAGLIGGMEQIGNRWFVSWGAIPMHDRRLLVLEELKGTDTETIGRLTDMRSSGVAQLSKIRFGRAYARTRIIAVSNPRGIRPIAGYSFGLAAIHELIGSLEDVRRFDIAMAISNQQVSMKDIQKQKKIKIEPRFTSDICHQLVLFAWTRTVDQITFSEETEEVLAKQTSYLTSKYSSSFPLLDKGTTNRKIARLAVAMAIRTFSTDGENVVVLPVHVNLVVKLMDELYSDSVMGYLEYTQAQRITSEIPDPKSVIERIQNLKYPRDFARQIELRDDISIDDLQDWADMDLDSARNLLRFFVRKHCLVRDGREYHKTPCFISLIKGLEPGELLEDRTVDEEFS